jgi:type VII secretion protein EccB
MQTRREQVRAYRFVTRRIVSALLAGEPETTDLPMRRLAGALLASAMLGAIVFAGVGAYGLLNPGGARPEGQALIIERETGARYLYLDDVLYPVLNYASARLIMGTPDPVIRTMSQNSLRELRRGLPLGIAGAPDSLPAPGALVGLPWTVCSAPRSADVSTPVTHLTVGSRAGTGSDLADTALLVISDGDTPARYLIWRDKRLKVKDRSILTSLNLTSVPSLPVGQQLINAITAGPDLAPLTLPDAGQPTTRPIGGAPAKIGQLYHVGDQHYVAIAAGLAPVGEVTATLLRAGGATDQEITARDAGSALVDTRVEPDGFPTTVPKLRSVDADQTAVCASYGAGDANRREAVVELLDSATVAPVAAAQDGGGQVTNGVRATDRVSLPGGHGALVQAVATPGATATGAPLYLVTDQGIRYPIPNKSPDVQAALGYRGVTPVQVPAALVALIPLGPALDPAAARSFAGRAAPSRPASPTPRPDTSTSNPPNPSNPPKPSPSSPKPKPSRSR